MALELLPSPLVKGISLSQTSLCGTNVGHTFKAVSIIKFSSFVGISSPNGCEITHSLEASPT